MVTGIVVLIDTWWNVNLLFHHRNNSLLFLVLIDTWWNVNINKDVVYYNGAYF